MKPAFQKCAIYTRKSHEKGLEQEFNTLDAQREACLAYIASQKSEGWVPVKQLYDDGGYSGGSMQRPALQQLIEDIKAVKVNVIVVYKIDRLTRSLADFAKLVDVFDQYGVSFVSVTQSFNTTTSMGRLTLNVLLSFAQFEREVIGERIRDKIAASKQKGMWMGGCPPLGYEVKERRLHVVEKEAETVRYIFDTYLELKSIKRLKEHLDMKGIKSKAWVSVNGREHKGMSQGAGALHHLLSNPVYAGYVRHRREKYEGTHEPVVPREKWQQVQDILISMSRTERGHSKQTVKYFLKGKIFNKDGELYTPMRANKGGKQYLYYVNQLGNKNKSNATIARLPAYQIETLILENVNKNITDIQELAKILKLDLGLNYLTLQNIAEKAQDISLHSVVDKVIVTPNNLEIYINLEKLTKFILEEIKVFFPVGEITGLYKIEIAYYTKRAQRGAVLIKEGNRDSARDVSENKIAAIVKGIVWRDEHFQGKSFAEIAKKYKCSRSFVMQAIDRSIIYNS